MIQRSFQAGDRIHEHEQRAGIDFQVAWKVAERVRPARAIFTATRRPGGLRTIFERGERASNSVRKSITILQHSGSPSLKQRRLPG
jgi:hypothetical protein